MQKRPFNELGLSAEMLKAVSHVGYEVASPIQSASIPLLLEGRDIVGQSQTGSGKTAAFALPAIEKVDPHNRAPQVLILCPTRELAVQVAEEVARFAHFKRGVKELPIYGGASYERQFMGLKSGAQIVIGTPGRIMDHLERKSLKLDSIAMVILDEADRMLDMGFREDIETILKASPVTRQTVLFSATVPAGIKQIITRFTNKPEYVRIESAELTVPAIDQVYYEVNRRSKLEVLGRLIDMQDVRYGIIFCATKMMVDELTEHLIARGYLADKLHGDIAQNARERVVKRLRDHKIEFLVATDVAARGLDIDDLEVVFNYDLPHDAEDYVHRIGRTGRAGRSGRAITFADGREVWKLQHIMRFTKSRIRRENIPTADEVEQRRTNILLEKVRELLDKATFRKYDSFIDRLLDAGHTPTDICSALFTLMDDKEGRPSEIQEDRPQPAQRGGAGGKYPAYPARRDSGPPARRRDDEPAERFDKRSPRKDKDKTAPARQSHEAGMLRLSMNAGNEHSIRPGDVVGFILNETGLPRESLGAIHITDKITFIDVREEHVATLIEKSQRLRFKGRKLFIQPA